jgi:enoyl ACP reductase
MGLLDGRKLLVTGVLTDASLAFAAAREALDQGATVVLTGAGRGLRITERTARKLPGSPPVLELDVTDEEHLATLPERLSAHVDHLDGVLHAIGFAPEICLGHGIMPASWPDVATALQVSTYSLKALVEPLVPMLRLGSHPSVVGLDFDATVAWPAYDWMGVAKAGLESLARYLARDLGRDGIRVNLIAAGPIRTMAARSIPGFGAFEDIWHTRAPLGWDIHDGTAVGKACVALLSDLLPATTGEILHVDGGFHATGV